jgi:membrane protease subunit (stomatin/prohibitin family)
LFKGGTYTLTTENIPLLSAIYKVPSGEQTFHSEVYFINKTVHTGIKWGTNSRIRMFDPYSGMHIALGASGKFNLAVSDSKRLILKLVGTTDIFAHSHTVDVDEEDNAKNSDKNKYRNDDTKSSDKNKARNDSSKNILDYIKSVIVTKVRTSFASVIKENGWSILEIDAHIEELSDGIKQKINPELEDYGLTMPEFFIMSISTPEDSDDPNERADYLRMKRQFGEKYLNVTEEQNKEAIALAAQKRKLIEAETAAQLKVIEAQGKAESMKLEGFAEAEVQRAQGYNVKDKMAFDVQKTFAENIGNIGGNGGSAMGDLVGLGAGLGMMSKIGKQVGNMMDMTSDNQLGSESVSEAKQSWDCSCGAKGVTGKFCNECGKPKPAPKETWDCDCGAKAQVGKFCSECGKQKPAPIEAWNCKCGAVGQTGKFCIECGEPRPTIAKTWDCACGAKNQTGKFCSECGKTRSDN